MEIMRVNIAYEWCAIHIKVPNPITLREGVMDWLAEPRSRKESGVLCFDWSKGWCFMRQIVRSWRRTLSRLIQVCICRKRRISCILHMLPKFRSLSVSLCRLSNLLIPTTIFNEPPLWGPAFYVYETDMPGSFSSESMRQERWDRQDRTFSSARRRVWAL